MIRIRFSTYNTSFPLAAVNILQSIKYVSDILRTCKKFPLFSSNVHFDGDYILPLIFRVTEEGYSYISGLTVGRNKSSSSSKIFSS